MSEADLPRTLGLMPAHRIANAARRVPQATIDRFLALEDLSGTVSDVLDTLGVKAVVGASRLVPTLGTARVVGNAVTVRNVAQTDDPFKCASGGQSGMAELEAIHQAQAGDVLVVQGVPDVSNMGGIIAGMARQRQIAGAVIDGGVRDVAQSRRMGFPIWSRSVSPMTGKWRCITVEINGQVEAAGVAVRPGDLVIADETGICFVPHALVDEVLARAEAITLRERTLVDDITAGLDVPGLVRRLYPHLPA